uniref:Uncharacterized protein n=1 Tax=Meloidogyne enterolobii TaxID=390850 RepID=A0A6V7U8V4_MELEN|nr:unnamed protein product [Meloidogyne enterolobii]
MVRIYLKLYNESVALGNYCHHVDNQIFDRMESNGLYIQEIVCKRPCDEQINLSKAFATF